MQKRSDDPPFDCDLCPRLISFLNEVKASHPTWHNGPVPSFGLKEAPLLVVGLAPGMKGANRTGRPFTGDFAGDLLYETLIDFGFARGVYQARPDDGMELHQARLTNAVRCLPPQNKPVGQEITTCNAFLQQTMTSMPELRLIIALGRIAHEAIVKGLGGRQKDYGFAHGAEHEIGRYWLFDSYHCSRYNTNTGRLTREMFRDVFRKAQLRLAEGEALA